MLPVASLNWTDPGTTIKTTYENILIRIDNSVPLGIESLGSCKIVNHYISKDYNSL